MEKEKYFDSFFIELIHERNDEMPCPPKEEIWERIITQLKDERKKERKRLFKRVTSYIAASIIVALILSLYVIPRTNVLAFTNKIIKSIIVVTQDTIKIYKKVDPTDKENSLDYLFGRDIDDPRIGDAQKKIHFRLSIPEYIPKEYKLSSVDVLNKFENKETVTFLYLNSSSDRKDYFEIIQRSFPNGSDVTVNIKKGENTKIENLIIDATEYTFVSYEENLNGILWDSGNIGYEISGNLTKNEIIKVTKSIK